MSDLLRVEGLSKRFGGLQAVQSVSFNVEPGEIVGLIGPNGAGKSTCFAMVAGALKPSAGSVHFQGADVTGWSASRAAFSGVARTFQLMRPFSSMSVFENVMVGAYLHASREPEARRTANEILDLLSMDDERHALGSELTAASRKKLEIARSLATNPKLVLLDEVMSGLTPTETHAILDLVRRLPDRGLSVLLVEHVMEVVMPLCERVLVLDRGVKIADDTPDAVARDTKVIEAYLGRDHSNA